MKRIGEFLKTTILGGLFVLLPVVLVYLILVEIMQLAVALATPIADLFPEGTFDRVASPELVALLLIIAVSFLLGLMMLAGPGRALGLWIERAILLRIPGYEVMKSLTRSMANPADAESFKPALLRSDDGSRELIYVIERLEGDRVVVMLPWAPTPMAGSVKIVDQARVEPLNASLADVTKVLGHWGVGARHLLNAGKPSGDTHTS